MKGYKKLRKEYKELLAYGYTRITARRVMRGDISFTVRYMEPDKKKGKESMNNFIKLVDDILKNMEYIRLLLEGGHKYVTPLHTFDLVVRKLNKLKVMLDTEYLTPEQIREAVIRLEKPIEYTYKGTFTPTEYNTFTGENPFYRDSVGTEELHEEK